jgi:DNA repair exonuclease SbcCD ATPase subunit
MYLSSSNPNGMIGNSITGENRHTKLASLSDNIKAGFYFIENKIENNERYMNAFNKGRDSYNSLDYSSEDMNELKEKTNEAVKEVKSAWKALSSIKSQVQLLHEELEHNQRVAEEMVVILKHIKNGDEEFNIPSNYFSNLLSQFENRLNQYKRRIDEMEEIIINTNQAREQKQMIGQEEGMGGFSQAKLSKI